MLPRLAKRLPALPATIPRAWGNSLDAYYAACVCEVHMAVDVHQLQARVTLVNGSEHSWKVVANIKGTLTRPVSVGHGKNLSYSARHHMQTSLKAANRGYLCSPSTAWGLRPYSRMTRKNDIAKKIRCYYLHPRANLEWRVPPTRSKSRDRDSRTM